MLTLPIYEFLGGSHFSMRNLAQEIYKTRALERELLEETYLIYIRVYEMAESERHLGDGVEV